MQGQETVDATDFEDVVDDMAQNKKINERQQKLPVYSADYSEQEDAPEINLNEGDLVKHNKYGLGTITKITTHGNKILCHINFENFGRRLLDPVLSQLQKIE